MIAARALLKDIASDTPFQPATSLWRAVELARIINSPFPQGRGLDLGCGDGRILMRILEHVGPREMAGIDLDSRETDAARASGAYTAVHTGPASAIPEPDASFDFVFSNSVLEHIPDLDPVFAEIARVLKPGGTLLFTAPATTFPDALYGPLLPWQDRARYLDMMNRRIAIQHLFSPENTTAWLDAAGLEVESLEFYLRQGVVRRWEFIARITSGLLYTLTGKRKHPIEIQHALNLRDRRQGPLARLAVLITQVLAIGALDDADPRGRYTGLLVYAKKRGADANRVSL